MAKEFLVQVAAVTWVFRILVVTLPVVVFGLTYWYLSAFVRSGARSVLRVPATAFIPQALRRREPLAAEQEPGEVPEEVGS
jgi:hypothetical protein